MKSDKNVLICLKKKLRGFIDFTLQWKYSLNKNHSEFSTEYLCKINESLTLKNYV